MLFLAAIKIPEAKTNYVYLREKKVFSFQMKGLDDIKSPRLQLLYRMFVKNKNPLTKNNCLLWCLKKGQGQLRKSFSSFCSYSRLLDPNSNVGLQISSLRIRRHWQNEEWGMRPLTEERSLIRGRNTKTSFCEIRASASTKTATLSPQSLISLHNPTLRQKAQNEALFAQQVHFDLI